MMHLQQQQKRIDQGNAAHRSVPRAKVFSTVGKPLITSFDAGVDLRDVQIAARHADPRTTMRYDPGPQEPRPPPQLHPRRLHGIGHLTRSLPSPRRAIGKPGFAESRALRAYMM